MKSLNIAKGFSLPLEAVTQAIGILAKRRAGKSYTMRRLAEQLLKAGQQVVIVDPKGDQWGVRFAVDGVSPGLPVIILGGERADVPLEVHSGEVVARLVVEDQVSVLLDLSLFRKAEVATFMSSFLENLYRLKAREVYRTPMMLIIDEADAIAPQKPFKGEERMLGAAEDIVRRGGQRGIGCTLVSQRSAVLNKNVLTQVQLLVVLRTIAPQDLAAIDAWIDVHGTNEERQLLKASLPSLPVGDAWFWSPGWPTTKGIFERVHVSPIETFDSAATPRSGEKRVEPKNPADVDIEVLKKQMAATIEKAKAEDPKELQKIIRERDQEIKKLKASAQPREQDTKRIEELTEQLQKAKATPSGKPKIVEKRILAVQAINRLEAIADKFAEAPGIAAEIKAAIREGKEMNAQGLKDAAPLPVPSLRAQQTSDYPRTQTVQRLTRQLDSRSAAGNGDLKLSSKQQEVLNALAWLETIGITRPSGAQLGAVAMIDTSGGYFSNVAGPLSVEGLIVRGGGVIELTDAGRAQAEMPDRVATLNEYHDMLRTRVQRLKSSNGKSLAILNALITKGGESMTGAEIGEAISVDHTGGYFSNSIGPLSTLGLIERGGGLVRPTSILFPPGLF